MYFEAIPLCVSTYMCMDIPERHSVCLYPHIPSVKRFCKRLKRPETLSAVFTVPQRQNILELVSLYTVEQFLNVIQ